jgi:hypothetical protein
MKRHSFYAVPCISLPFVVLFADCTRGASAKASDSSARAVAKEIFVLPAGYRGPFLAIYDQDSAEQPTWQGDTAVYNVPPSGVVRIGSPEPQSGTRTSHVFANRPGERIPNYPTCADMRAQVPDSRLAVCWLDFSIRPTGTPDHVVAVVTDWIGIPANFERTTVVYDSVLLGGHGIGVRGWEEPRDLKRRNSEASKVRSGRSSRI